VERSEPAIEGTIGGERSAEIRGMQSSGKAMRARVGPNGTGNKGHPRGPEGKAQHRNGGGNEPEESGGGCGTSTAAAHGAGGPRNSGRRGLKGGKGGKGGSARR